MATGASAGTATGSGVRTQTNNFGSDSPYIQPGRDHYSHSTLLDLLSAMSWPLQTIMGIVLAESGGDPKAKHVNADGSVDRGLFQINNKAHPDVSDACAYNPHCALVAAHKIYLDAGRKFTPWSTYNNGAYKKQDLGASNADSAGPFGIGRGPGADTVVGGAINDTFGLMKSIWEKIGSGDFWLSVGKILLGIIALIMGVRFFAKEWGVA